MACERGFELDDVEPEYKYRILEKIYKTEMETRVKHFEQLKKSMRRFTTNHGKYENARDVPIIDGEPEDLAWDRPATIYCA